MALDWEQKKKRKPLDVKSAKFKAADYCVYQERSQQQVRDKLYDYGLHYDEVEDVLADLIVEGFLSETRFAKAFAGGKFRVNGWGKRKIIQGLKQHKISENCIKIGLEEIPYEDYYNKLLKHAEKKYTSLKDEDAYIIRGKLSQHLTMKGYEGELIKEVIDELIN
jgi:regulatory protein